MVQEAAAKTFSNKELKNREQLLELFKNSPIPEGEMLYNLPLFIKRREMMRILFMQELYEKMLNVHGVIMEFGVLWGKNLALYESFRGIYEPYNHSRRIVAFDTFSGFPSVHAKDGGAELACKGEYATTVGYEAYLDQIMQCHEQESPIGHIKKYELIKGDATVTVERYLKDHPETIIALAYFDFDIYEPTKKCLALIKSHLTKGSVIGFDELNVSSWPGETVAVREELGLNNIRVQRSRHSSVQSYMIVE